MKPLIFFLSAFLAILFLPPKEIVIKPVCTTSIECMKLYAAQEGIRPIHILALSAQESSLGKAKKGDGGCSRGYYHINLCVFPEAKVVIGNLKKETAWVAEKLIEYGYHDDIRLAIARYNAPYRPNYAYASKVLDVRVEEIKKLGL